MTDQVTVEKGSITINGTSLTVVDSLPKSFSVCIIPYTYEHTNFHQLKVGDSVNLEFDIIGKYVAKYTKLPEAADKVKIITDGKGFGKIKVV
jgi:riboflavin synthase